MMPKTPPLGGLEEVADLGQVHPGSGDEGPQAVGGEDQKGKEDALAELGDEECTPEGPKHLRPPRPQRARG